MAQTTPVPGNLDDVMPLPKLTLALQEIFGSNPPEDLAPTVKALQDRENALGVFREYMNRSDDQTIEIHWRQLCGDEADDCEEDLCDAPEVGEMDEETIQELTIDQCAEYKFYVDDTVLAKSTMARESYVTRKINDGIRAVMAKMNTSAISFLGANAGLNLGDSFGTPPLNPTEIAPEDWNIEMLSKLYLDAQVTGIRNPFIIDSGGLIPLTFNAFLDRQNLDGAGAFNRSNLFDITNDPAFNKLGLAYTGFLIDPISYATASKYYMPAEGVAWNMSRDKHGIRAFSIPVPGFTNIRIDVYVSWLCIDAERNLHGYEYIMRLKYDFFANPDTCPIEIGEDETDVVSGIIQYERGD